MGEPDPPRNEDVEAAIAEQLLIVDNVPQYNNLQLNNSTRNISNLALPTSVQTVSEFFWVLA
ncbi:hypothetical protein NQ317_001213 [Molorchus minor]|uniref:Uncharacterized protein n=1 Tax=Molorchus minor TaxID=1323400 RepID=A0ABQ9JRP7_9CUCU|nr:hypothetical protein NQ317_001213 [Molorchus minor]